MGGKDTNTHSLPSPRQIYFCREFPLDLLLPPDDFRLELLPELPERGVDALFEPPPEEPLRTFEPLELLDELLLPPSDLRGVDFTLEFDLRSESEGRGRTVCPLVRFVLLVRVSPTVPLSLLRPVFESEEPRFHTRVPFLRGSTVLIVPWLLPELPFSHDHR